MRRFHLIFAATLPVALALAGCGGGSGSQTSGGMIASTSVTPSRSGPMPSAGASCASFDPMSPTNGIATLPANLDCDAHSHRFVAEGDRCDPGTYRPTAGHLTCRADGKLIGPPSHVPPPCTPGETRTLPGGLVEKCVSVPPPH